MAKNEKEAEHLNLFAKLRFESNYQIDSVSESPDAIILTESSRIGVEHTQLHQPMTSDGLIVVEQEKIRDRIVTEAMNRFHVAVGIPIRVIFQFNDYYWLNHKTKNRLEYKLIDDYVSVIIQFISANIPQSGDQAEYNWSTTPKTPSWIQRLTIYYPKDGVSSTRWYRDKGGAVPYVGIDVIQSRISAKNKKLVNYDSSLERHMLLLVADSTDFAESVSLDHRIFETEFQSDFSEVYILCIDPVDPPVLKRLEIRR